MEQRKLDELQQKRAEAHREMQRLDEQIAKVREEQRSENVKRVKALMKELEVTLLDLESDAKVERKKLGIPSVLPPKYRNPNSGETWAGRGTKPRWIKEAIAKGRKVDEFLIVKNQG